jgi:hypothetical protein
MYEVFDNDKRALFKDMKAYTFIVVIGKLIGIVLV